MRAPSSLYSTDAAPLVCSASATLPAVEASIGSTGRPTTSPMSSSDSGGSVSAIRAVSPRSPESIAARRTACAGRSDAFAIASSSTPSSAPVRSSPRITRDRKSHSASVARDARSSSAARRTAADPAPSVRASTVSAASTSATVSTGSAEWFTSSDARLRHPTPMRP